MGKAFRRIGQAPPTRPKILSVRDVSTAIRLFVEGSESSTLNGILARDGNFFEQEWQTLWLPSVAIYMETNPRKRADFLVRGRGILDE